MKEILLKYYYKILRLKDLIEIKYNKVVTLKKLPPKVKGTDETLEKIIKEGCSISRFGDGEFALLHGKSIKFQSYNDDIGKRLRQVILSNESNHIVCIPCVFNDKSHLTEKAKLYWEKYLNLNINKIYKFLDFDKVYYDSLVTRLYMDIEDKSIVKHRFYKFKKIWNKRNLIIVEGNKSRLGIGNDLFDNSLSVRRIICSSQNAFSKYEEILNEVKKQDKSNLILIALGPTATVLSYDLHRLGYQAIDIGHIDIEYEWFLQGVTEKCVVDNKYNGEVGEGKKIKSKYDEVYMNQIIVDISKKVGNI